MERLYDYIQRFAMLNQQELDHIGSLLTIKHFGKKEVVTPLQQTENFLYFIGKGIVRKFFYRKKEEVVTQIAKEGDMVSSSVSFLSQTPSEYVVETLEPSTLFALSYGDLQNMFREGSSMERLGRLVTLDWLLQKEMWEHDRIRQEPRERFIRFMNENQELVQRVPQKYLASYLNMKPETFSRYKHLLRK
jgi:CRP-like cAMP-binding protein